jgi:hypothetical protein
MTERRTQFEGEWADGSGKAVLDVGPLPTTGGLRVSVAAEGGWPGLHDAEMRLTPGEAVRVAHALLSIAAADAGTASQIGVNWTDPGLAPMTGWLFSADLLT